MFELLLIIYLLPVLIIGMLLLKLVFWLLKIAIRLASLVGKKGFHPYMEAYRTCLCHTYRL